MQIEETNLPGIGVRYDFETRGGDRIGVIVHESGERDLLVYDHSDPDACRPVRLSEEDMLHLGEILGLSERRSG